MTPITPARVAAAGTNNHGTVLTVGMATSPPVSIGPAITTGATAVVPSRRRMILVLGAMVALGPLTIDMYLPALPRIADELGVSSSVAQLTLTGTLAGLALGQLVVGPLSDSLGRRRPLLAGIVLHMLASLLCLVSPDIGMLAIARGLQGVGAAAAMVVAVAVVGDLFSDSAAATVMSRLMLILGVAPIVAPSLGAAVLLHASWHWVFAVLIVLAVSFVSKTDARLVGDIEKLINKPITQIVVPGFEPEEDWCYPPSGKKRDRSALNSNRSTERSPRSERSDRNERSERRPERSDRPHQDRTRSHYTPKPSTVAADGFDFNKPYESTASTPSNANDTKPAAPSRRPGRMVAALLGGIKKTQP